MKINCQYCDFPNMYQKGFASEAVFIKIKKEIEAKVTDGNFKSLGLDPSENAFFHELYECKHCGCTWTLCIPDQAYRGGLKRHQKKNA